MKLTYLVIAITLGSSFTAFGQAELKHIRKGNKLYYDSAFSDSEIAYRKALEEKNESEKAKYNLAGSLYKQGRFDEAQNIYQELAQNATNKDKLANYYHNLGNSYLNSGKIKESIEAYKSALRNNPTDDATKYNLSYALKMLQQQQQNQQQQNQQNQQENGQEQQQQQEQNQQEQRQEQEQQEQQQQQQPQQAEISEEDARRLLEAIENEEKELQKKLLEKQKTKPARTDKNW